MYKVCLLEHSKVMDVVSLCSPRAYTNNIIVYHNNTIIYYTVIIGMVLVCMRVCVCVYRRWKGGVKDQLEKAHVN